MSINNQIAEKVIVDEFFNTVRSFNLPLRQLRVAAFRGEGLKELSVAMRARITETSNDLVRIIENFAELKNIKGGFPAKYEALEKFAYSRTELNNIFHNKEYNYGLTGIIRVLRTNIKQIDSIISNTQVSYKIKDSNDERWNKGSIKHALYVTGGDIGFQGPDIYDEENYNEIDAILNKKKLDIYSPEYGKIVVKALRSYKSDLISTINRYFGKNSPFAEMNLIDIILA